jgi:type IV pilus assembly protein PilE
MKVMSGNVKKTASGFSLTELMIVVVVIAILAGIAYPSYTQHVIKTRRTEAQRALLDLANRLERNYLNASPPSYTQDMKKLGYTALSDVLTPDGYYRLSVTQADSDGYTIQAVPVAGTLQAKDTDCMTLTLDSTGKRSATGRNPSVCWQK